MKNAAANTKRKAAIASKALRQWANDGWQVTRTAPPPSVNQTVRALCMYIHNLHMTPSGVFGYYGANGLSCMIRFHYGREIIRPAVIKESLDKDGKRAGASMVSEHGFETVPTIEAAERLWTRYARFCHHMRETRHNWQYIGTVNYADNSTEKEYHSQLTGEIRRVMVTAPGGDLCY